MIDFSLSLSVLTHTAPNGIYSLNNSTQLTVNPTTHVTLQWSIYSTQSITYQHIDKTGMASSTRPGTFTISNVTECIQPKNNMIKPRLPRLATVSVTSINIEDTGQFVVMDSQFTSSVNVTGKFLSSVFPLLTSIVHLVLKRNK